MNTSEKIVECPHCGTRLRMKTQTDVIMCPNCNNKFPTSEEGLRRLKFTVTSTDNLDGCDITSYLGIISAQAVLGVNLFRDIMASFKDAIGGRSKTLENALKEARDIVTQDIQTQAMKMNADAVVRMTFDYETLGEKNGMMMVIGSGTAVKYQRSEQV